MQSQSLKLEEVRYELGVSGRRRESGLRLAAAANEQIGQWTEVARRAGLTLTEVAELAGVSVSTIRRLHRAATPKAAGWYPAPLPGQQQRWDGFRWMLEFRPDHDGGSELRRPDRATRGGLTAEGPSPSSGTTTASRQQ